LDDFVPVLLTWWIEAILALQVQGAGTIELLFTEGPFLTRVKSLGGDRLVFSFIESQLAGERLHYSAPARVGGFLRSLISASDTVLKAARRSNFSSQDMDGLVKALQSLCVPPRQGRH
jgi:riboflavin biosynthesis pyrimidine reductase